MRESLLDIVTRLNDLNGEDLADAVTQTDDVQWCLSELRDILGIIGDMSVDHLREMVQADREGRCVVLPCKVGDTVYQVETSKCKNMDLYKCEDYCYGFGNCWEGESFVKEVKFELWMIACINKTVFLNRESAEKALEEMEGE